MKAKTDEKLSASSWYVDTLGAAGLPLQKNGDYAPPPPESYGALFLPDTVEKGYHVEELKDGVYWLTSGWYDCMFVCTGNGVIAVDAPCGIGERILDAISSVTDEPVTHMVYSHWHADHVGAASIYGETVKRYGHEKTRELLNRFPDQDRLAPVETFSENAILEVSGVKLELSYKGQNHSEGNIFIYAPKQKVLAAIDIVAPGWVAFKGCDSSDNLSGWLQAHDQILEYDFDAIVCGHVARYGTREDVLTAREYALDLVKFSREALLEVPLKYFLKQLGDGPYKGAYRAAEENYFNAITNLATKRVLERTTSDGRKWTDRLNGADVMTKNNVSIMIDKLRMEQNHNGFMRREGPPKGFYP
jgi:glyoxylase-like metal-dependent hydrolase (beta-lactamase superfamily II)